MKGFRFHKFTPDQEKPPFEQILDIFLQLLPYTSGDARESLDWLEQLDKEYNLFPDNYKMEDFVRDLKEKGYLKEDENQNLTLSPKTEKGLRIQALEEIFGKLKRTSPGEHRTSFSGPQGDFLQDPRPFQFGDSLNQIDYTDSIRNAHVRSGIDDFNLNAHDLVVRDAELFSQTSTVLMIDISHSMILYGEDRITPAKKVAMALSELILTRYPKDTLDIVVFGNDAWTIEVKDLPYLQVGPFHTNTVAGLELAINLLKRRKNPNKQIFMITDGKPTCLNEDGGYYKNSFGLDRKIVNKTLNQAIQCRKLKIPITTFMIAQDPYLQEFVEEFTQANKGRAFYSSLKGLGHFVMKDFQSNRIRKS